MQYEYQEFIMLIIFSGLPGTGKTTISKRLAQTLRAVYLRVDTIEQTLMQYLDSKRKIAAEGYQICYAIAKENLCLNLTVIADSVNPVAITREAWQQVATEAGSKFIEIELYCADKVAHKRRVETRHPDIAGHKIPTWQEVLDRDYERWESVDLRIDTAQYSVLDSTRMIIDSLKKYGVIV